MQPRSPEEQALEVGLLADGQGYPWKPPVHWMLPVKDLRACHLGWGVVKGHVMLDRWVHDYTSSVNNSILELIVRAHTKKSDDMCTCTCTCI